MKFYGYIGITREQNKYQQQETLKEYAIKNHIKYTTVFEDKLCEKSFERPNFRALQRIIRFGDVVIIKGLKNLGRNYKEIQQELQELKVRGAKLLILDILMLQGIQDELLDAVLQDTTINLMDYVA